MKILAFAASNSAASINRDLVAYATARLKEKFVPDANVTTLNIDAFEMAIYSPMREEASGVPQLARDFHAHIAAVDSIIVSFAEHNGATSAAWKNIFDWMSRLPGKVWQDKPIAFFAASPGGRAGANVLGSQAQLAPHMGADLRGICGIGNWADAWDPKVKTLRDADDIARVDALLAALCAPKRAS